MTGTTIEQLHKILNNQNTEISKDDISRDKMLKKFGFPITQTKSLPKMSWQEQKVKERYEKMFYPYVFITLQQINFIVKNFSLVLGHTQHFIGDIPNANLLEIDQFMSGSYPSKIKSLSNFTSEGKESKYPSNSECELIVLAPAEMFSQHINDDPSVLVPIKTACDGNVLPFTEGYLVITKWGNDVDVLPKQKFEN